MQFDVLLDDSIYTPQQQKAILDAIAVIENDAIVIDKSYVAYDGTKYEKCFIREQGWNELLKLMQQTDYGKNATTKQNTILNAAYNLLMSNYVIEVLDDTFEFFDRDGIDVKLKDKKYFMIEVLDDTYKEWQRYPGKWQLWK